MALGIHESKEELIATLGENGELKCNGTMKDGRTFELIDGKLKVNDGAGLFEDAETEEINEVLHHLQARFGKEKVQRNAEGKIVFLRTNVEKLADELSAAKKSVKKTVGELMGEDMEEDPGKKRAHSLGMVSEARRLFLEGLTRDEVKTELETKFHDVDDMNAKVEEALNEAISASRRKDRARLRVTEEGLTDKIRQARIDHPTWTKAQVEANLLAGVKTLTINGKNIERSDPEVEEIFEAAFKKEANEDWWKARGVEAKKVLTVENAKTAAKWGALGLAGAATLTAAGIAGIGALLWKGAKVVAGPIKKVAVGGARLTWNVGRHLVSDGKNVVVAAGQSLIVNPIKAVGTMVSKPFVRAYQAFNWGRKYPAKPNLIQAKKWYTKPWQWARNGVARTAYRTKQASLALAAAATFGLYGVGEGVTNAASRDLLGTDWTVPAPQFLEHSAPAAPSAGHGPMPAAHAPEAAAHPAPHGAGH